MDTSVYYVAVVGRFSSGKSSLTNGLLVSEGESVSLERARNKTLADNLKKSMVHPASLAPDRFYITGACGHSQRERLNVDHLFGSKR